MEIMVLMFSAGQETQRKDCMNIFWIIQCFSIILKFKTSNLIYKFIYFFFSLGKNVILHFQALEDN